jgi:predicted transcriptional regulator
MKGIAMSAKQAARELIEQLPESVSWNDLMYELYVKQKIEEGLQQLDEGRGISHEEAKRRLLGESS